MMKEYSVVVTSCVNHCINNDVADFQQREEFQPKKNFGGSQKHEFHHKQSPTTVSQFNCSQQLLSRETHIGRMLVLNLGDHFECVFEKEEKL